MPNQTDALLQNIQEIFRDSDNIIFQKRNTIKLIEHNQSKYVVKQFKTPNYINKIVYSTIRDSKARKSFDNSLTLGDFTPKPIGYREFKKNGLLFQSYYISEYFDYDFTIRGPLTDSSFANKTEIYQAFASFTKQLHDSDIMHLDYSPGNILVKKVEDGYTFKVIDVNRMKFDKLSVKSRLEGFSKLWASDEDLEIIVREYASLIKYPADQAISIAQSTSQKHKNKINLKKRLKGKPVVD